MIRQAAVSVKSTPEGVPEGYEYVPPEDRDGLPDDAETVETNRGAVYVAPSGEGEDDGDESDNIDTDYPSAEGNYALTEGDPRRIIENEDSAQLLADSFDEDDSEFDYWQTYPEESDINEGSILEVNDEQFPIVGGGSTATVLDAEEGIAVTEFGERVEFNFDDTQPGHTAVRVWDDPANQVASGDNTWDNFGEDYIPDEVQEVRTPENIAVDEEDAEPEGDPWLEDDYFEEEYGASTEDFEDGHLVAGPVDIEGEFRRLNYDRTVGDVPHFIDEDNNLEYADVDGVACRYMPTSRFPGHGEVYCSFDDDVADIEDGWYRQGDIIERDDGDEFYRELVGPDGEITEVDLTDIGDGVIDNIYRPVEVSEASSDLSGISDGFDGTYPEDADPPDNLTPDAEFTEALSEEQTDAIRAGMGKVQEAGLDDRIRDVQHIDESTFDRARPPIGMYDPIQETVHFTPDKFTSDYIGSTSDGFSVGDSLEDTVVHEAVHAAHVENLVENEDWDVNEIVDDLLEQNLDNGERMLLEEEVSEYGATNPLELVAEIGTMIVNGEEPSEEALYLYEKYGGPTDLAAETPAADSRRTATTAMSTKANGDDTAEQAMLAEAGVMRSLLHDLFTNPDMTQLSASPATVDVKATPEGVPDNAEYIPPDEEPPEDAEIIETERGATYALPDSAAGEGDDDRLELTDAERRADARGDEVQGEVSDILGDDPRREEFQDAEEYLETELAVENVDLSSFDAQQVETTAAELGRMAERGELDNLNEVSSQVPDRARDQYGDLPMHYDRDGKAVSIDPRGLDSQTAGTLAEEGVIGSDDPEHLLRHLIGAHNYAEDLESGEADPELDPAESADEQLDETDDIDPAEIGAKVGQLALATGVTLVAETYALVRGTRDPGDQALDAYRALGGPTLGDIVGGDDE